MYEKNVMDLGLQIPEVAVPVANYAPFVVENGWIYISGQLPSVAGKIAYAGKVGQDLNEEQGYQAAQVCALNCLGALKAALGSLDRVERIVKITGFVSSAPDFTGQPKVVNGASDLLAKVFGENGVHARSAVGVTALPLGACCEVELIAKIKE